MHDTLEKHSGKREFVQHYTTRFRNEFEVVPVPTAQVPNIEMSLQEDNPLGQRQDKGPGKTAIGRAADP